MTGLNQIVRPDAVFTIAARMTAKREAEDVPGLRPEIIRLCSISVIVPYYRGLECNGEVNLKLAAIPSILPSAAMESKIAATGRVLTWCRDVVLHAVVGIPKLFAAVDIYDGGRALALQSTRLTQLPLASDVPAPESNASDIFLAQWKKRSAVYH